MSLVKTQSTRRMAFSGFGSHLRADQAVWARLAAERASEMGHEPQVPVFHHAAPRRVSLFR